ncbi:hypothetical protein SLS55_007628 [Diplodia seriata]|uniref:Uncharacterized protein n=1 Tax=Diplodia seriata TaxID=420778 RepID=A0A1S8BHP1_9PEZI|nr:hypothetical protein BK809_0007031 [Diplodia seriata]
MSTARRTIRATKRIAKSLASTIRNKWEDLSAAAAHFFKEASTEIKDLLAATDWKALLQQIKNCIKNLATEIWDWVQAHPYQAGFIVLCILTITFTPTIVPPVLTAAGLTTVGTTASTIAAAVQSVISPVVAGGTFAILQSAAIGGYGVSIVLCSVQAVAAAGLVTMALWNYFFGAKSGDDDKDKKA